MNSYHVMDGIYMFFRLNGMFCLQGRKQPSMTMSRSSFEFCMGYGQELVFYFKFLLFIYIKSA